MATKALTVELRFLTQEGGGRHSVADLSVGFRTVAAAGFHDAYESTQELVDGEPLLFGISLSAGPSRVNPGDVVRATLTALVHPGLEQVARAGEFTVFGGRRIVARGRVVDHEAG